MSRPDVEGPRAGAATREPVADVVAWRRIALDQQLPGARFPAGVRAPSVVSVVGLSLVACLCLALFAMTSGPQVPQAVLDSQKDMVEQLVRAVDLGLQGDVSELADAADDYLATTEPSPEGLLAGLTGFDARWSGVAVVDIAGRQAVAAKGATVVLPQTLDPKRRTVTGRLADGAPEVVITVPLGPGRVLAASAGLRLRSLRLNPDAQHALLVGAGTGEFVLLQGVGQADEQSPTLVREALKLADARDDTVSLSTDINDADAERALVVSGTPIGRTGLYLVSTVRASKVDGGVLWQGLRPAGALIVVTLIGLGLTYVCFLRPVARLLTQSKSDACGAPGRRLRLTRPWEVARIAAALAGDETRRRGVTVMLSLVLVCMFVLAWCAGMIAHYGQQAVSVPAQVVSDESNRIESASNALGASLDLGLMDVVDLSAQLRGLAPRAARSMLERTVRNEPRFRGAYLLDASGSVVESAGRHPLRESGPLPGEFGLRLDRIDGRIPVIYAYHVQNNGAGVVAEFDIDYLTSVLRRMGGHLRVVDSGLRTILDTEGFLAFQQVAGTVIRDAAVTALVGGTVSSVVDVGESEVSGTQVVSSTGVDEPLSVAHLEWALVADRPVTTLALPATMRYRSAALVAGLAGALALFTLGWQYSVLVRPLRALANAAADVAGGGRDTPISLRRHDEIGAVAACLEICRQVTMYGAGRSGGAIRLRGADDDFTAVIPRFSKTDQPTRSTGRRS